MDVAMIALGALKHGGRELEAGDRFMAAPVQAAIYKYRHLARFARPDEAPAEAPTPAKGRTKRRDLRPEE